MSLATEFAKLYTTHVYKDSMTSATSTNNPRGLARAVDYTGNPLYPKINSVDPLTGNIEYAYGTSGSTLANLDAKYPSFLRQSTIPAHLEQDMIVASYISKRPIANTDIRELGAKGSSQLRVQGAVP